MKNLYVCDLQKSQVFENETFVIFESERLQDKNGNPYYSLVIGDKTGRLPAKIWGEKKEEVELKSLKPGSVAEISGKVEEFKGKLQLNILSLRGVNEGILEEYLEQSKYDSEKMMAELLEVIEKIKDKDIKKVIKKIFSEKEIARKFKYWPAAVSVHHDFRSGLLQHVLEMLEISSGLKKYYPEVNYDVLTAGIILHDLGKIYELDATGIVASFTKEGTLIGHIAKGALVFHDFAKDCLPENTYLHILHLILSHHGVLMYGSPVVPSSIEAVMLSLIDNLSAKSRIAEKAKSKIAKGMEFSPNISWLENAKIWNGGESQDFSDQISFT